MKIRCSILLTAAVLVGLSGQTYGATVTLFDDTLETHPIGGVITSQIPAIGEWGFTAVIQPGQHTVQADPDGGGGQALRSTRTGAGGSPGFPTARTLTTVEADSVVTIKWDWFREDAGVSGAVQGFYMGANLLQDATVNINGTTQELRSKNNNVQTNLGVTTGFGGWESFEMVVTFGPEDGLGQTTATYDLFFERAVANSQPILAKTLLVDDATINTAFDVGFGNMRWFYGLNPHFNNTPEVPIDATMYFDNILITRTIADLLPGDLDGDGFVGITDLNLVLGNWNQNIPPGDPLADPSGDNFVGIEDLNTVLGNWNAGVPPAAGAAVPEPASLALLGFGACAMLRRHK
jgi:PEP-CTERM motif